MPTAQHNPIISWPSREYKRRKTVRCIGDGLLLLSPLRNYSPAAAKPPAEANQYSIEKRVVVVAFLYIDVDPYPCVPFPRHFVRPPLFISRYRGLCVCKGAMIINTSTHNTTHTPMCVGYKLIIHIRKAYFAYTIGRLGEEFPIDLQVL